MKHWMLSSLLDKSQKKIIVDKKSSHKVEHFLQRNYCKYEVGSYYDEKIVSFPAEQDCIFIILEEFAEYNKMTAKDIYFFLNICKKNILLVNATDDAKNILKRDWYTQCRFFPSEMRERIVILADCVLSNKSLDYYKFFKNDFGNDIHVIEPDDIKSTYQRKKDFMFLCIARKRRAWRYILADHIQKEIDTSNSIIKIHTDTSKKLILENSEYEGRLLSSNIGGSIPWDLYSQVNFEIVPETCIENFDYITEKTLKPILCGIPFLVFSNHTFYSHIKNLGFKTFDHLIDESFATEQNLDLKCNAIVSTAKDIIVNGSDKFFEASKDITEYNKDHLYWMMGKKDQNLQDQFTSAFQYAIGKNK